MYQDWVAEERKQSKKKNSKKGLMSNRAMNCTYGGSADPWGANVNDILDSYCEYMSSKSWE